MVSKDEALARSSRMAALLESKVWRDDLLPALTEYATEVLNGLKFAESMDEVRFKQGQLFTCDIVYNLPAEVKRQMDAICLPPAPTEGDEKED